MTRPRLLLATLSLAFVAVLSAGEPAKTRPFITASLGNPRSIAVDAAGNLYVGDVEAGTIHRLTPRGEVSTLAGAQSIQAPLGLAVARDGAVIVADTDQNRICRITSDGTRTELGRPAAGETALSTPTGVAADGDGNLFITDNGAGLIRKIARDGTLTTFAGKRDDRGAADGAGTAARFSTPRGIAVDRAGNLYVADEGNHNIRKITPAGVVSTLAGGTNESGTRDGPGTSARFGAPRGLAVDSAGNVYVADADNHAIRKITPTGLVSTFAGQPGAAGGADGPGNAAQFSEPRGIAVDAAGNVFVADTGNSAVREITPDGTVTTIAAGRRP